MSFSPENRLKAEAVIAAKKKDTPSLDYEFIDYKGLLNFVRTNLGSDPHVQGPHMASRRVQILTIPK